MFVSANAIIGILILTIAGLAAPMNLIFPPTAEILSADNYFLGDPTNEIVPVSFPRSSDIIKRIEINLKTQRMKLFIDEKQVAEFVISSGKRKTPTKSGNFSILSKYPIAYGEIDGILWTMPYFMGIYVISGTENGIHELPLANGWRESLRDMGRPVSHGCVRLGVGDAQKVYNFAEIGTPVIIHY